ncbi:SgcJ/EcaC family oxidoreductase [Peristeroidobacter agariperforans]|uniref:SgcJ/EcaC family oxidoreductase n=1 Tax=Peristeroidobacter agariperforans TaxID=268404 RepID=UPI00101D2F42|nr:SgcJ/EcaC family oxidoreductase [Peristeroidobacter agariperforans]
MNARRWRLWAVAILASALALPLPIQAATTDSAEAANRAVASAFEAAWNSHDMKAFGNLLTADVVWINVDAGRGTGREMVEAGHARVHANKFKDSVITIKNVEVALLKPDVALVYVTWAIRGDRDNDGTPRQPREGLFSWVTVKQGDVWKIRSSHNTNKNVVR